MKECKQCGEEFEPKNPKGIFCTESCRQKDYRKRMGAIIKAARQGKSAVVASIVNRVPKQPQIASNRPVRLPNEDVFEYSARVNEWKKTQLNQ